MTKLKLSDEEAEYLKTLKVFNPMYIEYLKNYKYNSLELDIKLSNSGELSILITGKWHTTILWETCLMAIISEVYFKHNETLTAGDYTEYYERTAGKKIKLQAAGCKFIEFGTRRRRSFEIQEKCIKAFTETTSSDYFIGTSNVHFARLNNIKAIGTSAHEFTMGISGLISLKHANKFMLQTWSDVYRGNLGIALTDTFGTKAFFNDFDSYYARLYDGVRHDSGCPFEFTDKVINHYKSLNIDPTTKMIVFSDGLDVYTCIDINNYVRNRIKCCFGIGTNFTNDMPTGKKALNIVIKLKTINGNEVVKISDSPSKATGHPDALAIAFKTFGI